MWERGALGVVSSASVHPEAGFDTPDQVAYIKVPAVTPEGKPEPWAFMISARRHGYLSDLLRREGARKRRSGSKRTSTPRSAARRSRPISGRRSPGARSTIRTSSSRRTSTRRARRPTTTGAAAARSWRSAARSRPSSRGRARAAAAGHRPLVAERALFGIPVPPRESGGAEDVAGGDQPGHGRRAAEHGIAGPAHHPDPLPCRAISATSSNRSPTPSSSGIRGSSAPRKRGRRSRSRSRSSRSGARANDIAMVVPHSGGSDQEVFCDALVRVPGVP